MKFPITTVCILSCFVLGTGCDENDVAPLASNDGSGGTVSTATSGVWIRQGGDANTGPDKGGAAGRRYSLYTFTMA